MAQALTEAGTQARYWQNAGGRRWFGRLAVRLGRRDAEDLLGSNGLLLVESILRWLAIGRAVVCSALTGRVGVMDRYAVCQYASVRTHGGGRWWESLIRAAYRLFPAPQITFMLAVSPDEAHRRIERRATDSESHDYLKAADAAYRSLPEWQSFIVIDGNRPPDVVFKAIREYLPEFATAVQPHDSRHTVGAEAPPRG